MQREKIRSGRKDNKLRRRGWGGSAALAEGARLNSGGVRGGSYSVISKSREGSSRKERCQEF